MVLGSSIVRPRRRMIMRALLSASSRIDCAGVLATRAALCLRQGHAAEALAAAEDGLSRHKALGACGFFRGVRQRLVHAECLAAVGQRDAAHKAIALSRDRLRCIAEDIAEPAYRKSFLEEVPENRRTLDLALAWLGGGALSG
jgi:eukaryotic-like serine/threonine-protein kinase